MADLFFYGTLRHLALLETVMGSSHNPKDVLPAKLFDHQARAIAGHDFPMIVEMEGSAQGVLCRNLSEDAVARLNFYEGGFLYELRDVEVETEIGTMPAQVYFPLGTEWLDDGPWALEKWVSQNGELTVMAAKEVMAHYGAITADQLEFMFPQIRARAAAKLAASKDTDSASPSGFTRSDTTPKNETFTHRGFFVMNTAEVAFKKYDGGFSNVVTREVFVGADAAIVLPYDPVRDRVLLVEQFRAGPYVRGDQKPWMLEPIAGRIDPGETPEETAHREGWEEAKIRFSSLHKASKCYASPGCNTEYFHIFIGCADLPDDIAGVSGLEAESEDIKSYLYSYETFMEMTDTLQTANAPLVLAALWLSRHRERLRSSA